MTFVGRKRELGVLAAELAQVKRSGAGSFVLLRGRRRVGKSRLVEQFLSDSGVRGVFFTAVRARPKEQSLALFREALVEADIGAAEIKAGLRFSTWEAGLMHAGEVARESGPIVVVIDELPYLIEADPSVEGAIQLAWDRYLSRQPVMLVVIGSDLAMMAALTEHDRPLYDRPTRAIRLDPLNPSELSVLLGLSPRATLDAYLAIGGFPQVARLWRKRDSLFGFLRRQLADPTSPLIVSGERALNGEFPAESQARRVLNAIGVGERSYGDIGRRAGVARQSLDRALDVLVEKRAIIRMRPLSAGAARSKHTRYVVADPYLRFWLRYLQESIDEIDRGRGDLVLSVIQRTWFDYAGQAVETLIREAVTRMLPARPFAAAKYVGSFWTRTNDVQVDLVGVSEKKRPTRVDFLGSIKWRQKGKFTIRDTRALMDRKSDVPGADNDTIYVGVSRTGFDDARLDVELDPERILDAWSD